MPSPIFIDGFEQFDEGELVTLATLLPMAGYSGSASATAQGRRPGSRALFTSNSSFSRGYEFEGPVVSMGAAVRLDSRGATFLSLAGRGLSVNEETGRLSFSDATGEIIPALNRFYYYEIELDWGAGEGRVWVNGKLDIQVPLYGNQPESVTATLGGAGGQNRPPLNASYDDFYLVDGPRLGPIEVTTQMANRNSSPQEWETSAGPEENVSHASIVGAVPPDPLNMFIQTGDVGAQDVFTSSTQFSRNDTVRAASILALARVTRRTNQTLLVRSGDTTLPVGELSGDYRYYYTEVPVADGANAEDLQGDQIAVVLGAPA